MMTEALRRAIALVEQLPEAAQDKAAEKIQNIVAELADHRWDELLADPRSEVFFDQMIAEVEEERRQGTLRPWPHAEEQ